MRWLICYNLPLSMAAVLVDLEKLRHFHAAHFPDQPVPDLQTASALSHTTAAGQVFTDEGDDDLGYYEDGVKRTLTNEQIGMFRHSEIRRLLQERRRKTEADFDGHERSDGQPKYPVKFKTKIHDDSRGDGKGLQARGRAVAETAMKPDNPNVGNQTQKLVQYAEDER